MKQFLQPYFTRNPKTGFPEAIHGVIRSVPADHHSATFSVKTMMVSDCLLTFLLTVVPVQL